MRTVALALGLMAVGALALYDPKGPVILLNKQNFVKEIVANDHVAVVEFFAPWCGHCKAFAPEFMKAAENLKGIVKVAAVNCDEEKELCGAFDVKGFPTVKLFPSDRTTQKQGDKEGLAKIPTDYNGPRSAASLANAATALMPDRVVALTASTEAKFFENKELAKALLFTDKDKTPTLFKAMALEFGRGIQFARVQKDQAELVSRFKVTKFPTIIVVPADGTEPAKYNGPVQAEPLKKFLGPFFKAKNFEGAGAAKPEQPTETWELVRVTSVDELKANCLDKKVLCAIAFLDPYNFPDEQDEHESKLLELTEKFKSRTHWVWLGQMEQPDFVKAFDLRSGFPALVVVRPGLVNGKLRYSKFVGSFDVDSISNFIEAILLGRKGFQELNGVPHFADINPEDFKAPPPVEEEEEESVEKEL